MALSKIDAANFLTGTIPSGNIATSSLAAAATGKVLQVLYTQTASAQTISSGSYTDLTSMSLAITPSSSSNKILIRAGISGELTANDHGFGIGIVRGSTAVLTENTKALYGNGITELVARLPFEFLDSPSTTSATTYKIQVKTHDGNSVIFNRSSVSFLVLMEVAA